MFGPKCTNKVTSYPTAKHTNPSDQQICTQNLPNLGGEMSMTIHMLAAMVTFSPPLGTLFAGHEPALLQSMGVPGEGWKVNKMMQGMYENDSTRRKQ